MLPAEQVIRSLTFSFEAKKIPVGEMTNGQRYMENIYHTLKDAWFERNCSIKLKVDNRISVNTIDSSIINLLQRNETLRTIFIKNDIGDRNQFLLNNGTLDIICLHSSKENIEEAERNLYKHLYSHHFSLESIPVRIGYIFSASGVERVIILISHMAVDGASLDLLRNELHTSLDGGNVSTCNQNLQPLDLAKWEKSATTASIRQRAASYWQSELSKFPIQMFKIKNKTRAIWNDLEYRSEKMGDSIDIISLKLSIPRAAVMITTIGRVLASYSNKKYFSTTIYTSNRNTSVTRNIVANLAQASPLSFSVSECFIEDCKSVNYKLLMCSINGMIDVRVVSQLLQFKLSRPIVMDSRINILYRRPIREEVITRFKSNAYENGTIKWCDVQSAGINAISIGCYSPDRICYLCDERYFSRDDMLDILTNVESSLIETAKSLLLSSIDGQLNRPVFAGDPNS